MKRLLFPTAVLFLFFSGKLVAQTCNCMSLQSIASGASYVQAGNDFNCHMYVKAYFKDGHYGDWIPSIYYNFSAHNGSSIVYDPSFIEVTDPSQANAIYYPCDHSAVVRSSGCLISKANFGSDLYRHGLNNIGCSNTGIRYFKYVSASSAHAKGIDQSCLPAEPSCNVTCSISGTYNGSNPMYTVNSTTSYYNTATVTCSNAHHFTWTKTAGSAVYYACSNSNCSGFYFYLNNGQSVTFNVKSYDSCNNQLDSKSYTFTRGSWYYRPDGQSDVAQELNVFPNPSDGHLNLAFPGGFEGRYLIRDLQGREIHKSEVIFGSGPFEADLHDLKSGVYFIQAFDDATGKAFTTRFLIK